MKRTLIHGIRTNGLLFPRSWIPRFPQMLWACREVHDHTWRASTPTAWQQCGGISPAKQDASFPETAPWLPTSGARLQHSSAEGTLGLIKEEDQTTKELEKQPANSCRRRTSLYGTSARGAWPGRWNLGPGRGALCWAGTPGCDLSTVLEWISAG